MPVGDPGQEQFRRAVVEFRNLHIPVGVLPLINMRTEVIGNDDFTDRGGTDDPTRDHFIQLLVHADRVRRRVTHNPDDQPLGDAIEKSLDKNQQIDIGENPFGGDDIQGQSGGLINLPWALDGSNPNIPLNSMLNFKNGNGLILLGAIDRSIVNWTRLTSKDRTKFVTRFDSMRIYGDYQAILGFITAFMGDENRVDLAQLLPSEEPLGPNDSPNRIGETAGGPQGGV